MSSFAVRRCSSDFPRFIVNWTWTPARSIVENLREKERAKEKARKRGDDVGRCCRELVDGHRDARLLSGVGAPLLLLFGCVCAHECVIHVNLETRARNPSRLLLSPIDSRYSRRRCRATDVGASVPITCLRGCQLHSRECAFVCVCRHVYEERERASNVCLRS